MNSYTLINKNFTLSEDAKISIRQRGFKFGDGVFESCKIYAGKIYDFKSHKDRLERGLEALMIDFDTDNLEESCLELIAKNEIQDGILRFSVSRGEGSMGYLAADNINALLVAETMKSRQPRGNINLCVSETQIWKKPEFLQKCKTMQGLNYILAKMEVRKKGFFDGVMLSEEGFIGECSSSNIFWVKEGQIFTPSLKCGILPGCVRQKIIDNFEVVEIEAKIDELRNADELFLTNSNLMIASVDTLKMGASLSFKKSEITKKVTDFIKKDLEKLL